MTNPRRTEPYTLLNIFTPGAAGIDALIAFQLAETRAMADEATAIGWLGNEVHRATDGSSLIVLTRFRDEEAQANWARGERFHRHLEALAPFVDEVVSVPVKLVARHGEPPRDVDDQR